MMLTYFGVPFEDTSTKSKMEEEAEFNLYRDFALHKMETEDQQSKRLSEERLNLSSLTEITLNGNPDIWQTVSPVKLDELF